MSLSTYFILPEASIRIVCRHIVTDCCRNDIGRYAGAGSIVPITGFANSVASPAIEFRREGMIMGVGAKLFVISGPVLVYGISSSVLAGLIYWAIGRLMG